MERSDKKRILTKILVVIAALTLLSCCFLGSTFARYVTSSSGSGNVGVALWDVEITGAATGENTVSFKLSPDADQGGAGSTNKSAVMAIATIKNDSDVSANITFSTTTGPTAKVRNGVTEETTGYSTYFIPENTKAMFSIAFFSDADGRVPLSSGATTLTKGNSITIYAQVTWTTKDDETDTWYGMNVESISWELSYTATQNSEVKS